MLSYRKKLLYWFIPLFLITSVWFLVLAVHPDLITHYFDRYRMLRDHLLSPLWCLILYMVSQIALIVIFFVTLNVSNKNVHNWLHGMKEDLVDDFMFEYLLRRNRVFGFNLFFYFTLIFLLWNYLFIYTKAEWLIPGNLVLQYLILIISANVIITSRVMSYAQSTWLVEKFKSFFDRHPDMDHKHWKWRYFYYNPADVRLVVPKRGGVGITFNHAHMGFALLCYGVVIMIIILALMNI